MTNSSKIRSRAAAHPRALARSPAGTDPPLVTEQATPRPVPLRRSLALQVPLLLVVALALAVAVGAWSLRAIVLHSFERLEVANAELDLRRFANAIDYQVAVLARQFTNAVEHADDASDIVLDVLPLESPNAARTAQELACVFDSTGALLSTESDDPADAAPQRVNPLDFCHHAEGGALIAQALAGRQVAGLYDAGGTYFLIAAGQVLPSRNDADRAALLLARHLSAEELQAIVWRMAINIDFWSMDTPDLDVMEAAAGAALSLGAPFVVNRRSEAVLQVYWAFEGADGEPAFLARANVFRDLREIGDETVLLSALAMAAVGLATILLSLVLVRSLMVKRLSQLTGQLLSLRRDTLGGRRLRVDRGPLGQRDEISVLAEEFDTLLGALAATTRQLADVSYRAGRAEVTEGSLHNIGNALNSLLASADSARAKVKAEAYAKIEQATKELAAADDLTERQSKLAQYAALAATDAAERFEALRTDIERVLLHVNRIEEILDSQRRFAAEGDFAVASELLPLVQTVVAGVPEGIAGRIAVRIDTSVGQQPPVLCVPSAVVQVLSNLLTNAVEAIERGMPARGLIYIMASTVEVEGMRMVDLSVTDNGVGLDVEEPVKIFQRYYTTKSVRGHGIGLHWSANVVTSMGGHLFARSGGKGRGTSLHLRVPVAP